MSYRTRNIVIASGLALVAVIFMVIYASSKKGSSSSDVAKGLVSVLYAAREIPQGTPASTLDNGAFVAKKVPQDAVAPGAITKPSQVAGTVATANILQGEQVTSERFGPVAAAGVLVRLKGDQRVVQLAGDRNQVLDGTVKPGDHVDVIGSWSVSNCTNCQVTGIIARNVLVLATTQQLGSSDNGTPIQLRLSNAQADRVFWMEKNGSWSLVLRPVVKPKNRNGYVTGRSILNSTLNSEGLIR
jgi:Flp pilus assembly protein CpaB